MQSINESCVYKNKTCNYINGSFIYIIKDCIYSFLITQKKFGSYTKEVWVLYKGSLSLIEKKFSYNSLEAIY